jgi:glycosyltransferase involved in cell wall biosynthesis
MTPKVSIIIPVYNVEKYVERCLDSVYIQDYSNFEVIIIDDGSTDKSAEIVDKSIKKNNAQKITTVISQHNKGLSAARNKGLQNISGSYVLFVDSDDYIAEHTIKILVNTVNSVSDMDFCCFRCAKVCDDGKPHIINSPVSFQIIDKNDIIIKDALLGHNIKTSVCCKFYRTEFLKKNSLTFVNGIINEDTVFTFSCALHANKVVFENSVLYYVYSNEYSISRDIKERNFTSVFTVLNCIKKEYELCNNYNKYKKYIYAGWTKLSLFTLVQAAFRLDYFSFHKYYKIFRDSDYSNKDLCSSIKLVSVGKYLMYRLSLLPKVFYTSIRFLKYFGLHMQ